MTIAGLLSTGTSTAVGLEVSPYAGYRFESDTNLFDSPSGSRDADQLHYATLGGDIDWNHARQHVTANAEAARVLYRDNNYLDHTDYRGNIDWDYAIGALISGTASYTGGRYLNGFENRSERDKDFIERHNPVVDMRLAITPHWSTLARIGYLDRRHTLATERRYDRTEIDSRAELTYETTPGTRVTLGAARIDGDFPQRGADDALAHGFTQHTPYLRLAWRYSGVSSFIAQGGYTWRNDSGGQASDWSAPSGRVAYIRDVSGQTQLMLMAAQDIYSADSVAANALRDRYGRVILQWRYGPSLALASHYEWHREDYLGTTASDRRDTTQDYGAELTWQPTDRLALTAQVSRVDRNSNLDDARFDKLVGGVGLRYTLNPQPRVEFGPERP